MVMADIPQLLSDNYGYHKVPVFSSSLEDVHTAEIDVWLWSFEEVKYTFHRSTYEANVNYTGRLTTGWMQLMESVSTFFPTMYVKS